MHHITSSIPLLYLALLAPGWLSIWDLIDGTWYYPQMMLESGLMSIWLLILTISVSPFLTLIKRMGFGMPLGRWMLHRRKHFGLASCFFAVVHAVHYLRYTYELDLVLAELFLLEFALGWLSLVVFVILAVTSNRFSTRRLGRYWKPLHQLVYLAAGLAFLHWFFFDPLPSRVSFWGFVFALVKALQLCLGRFRGSVQFAKI